VEKLLAPREAANVLGISYPTLKQWIYHGKIKSVKTPGGHHRVPESEIDRLFPKKLERGSVDTADCSHRCAWSSESSRLPPSSRRMPRKKCG
jgi:excisionase family DNA binding protein